MTLSKQNIAVTNQLENFITSSEEKRPQTAEELESFVELLIDLEILNAPQKKKQEAINADRDYTRDSESIDESWVAEDRDIEEIVALTNKASETDSEKQLLVEEPPENGSTIDLNNTLNLDESPNINGKSESIAETQNDSLSVIPNPDENKLKNSDGTSDEKAEAVLLALLSALNINVSDRKKEKSAEVEVSESNLAPSIEDIEARSVEKISIPDLTDLEADLTEKIAEKQELEVDNEKENKSSQEVIPNLDNLPESGKEQLAEVIPNLVIAPAKETQKTEEITPNLGVSEDREIDSVQNSNFLRKSNNRTQKETITSESKEEKLEELYDAYKRLQSALVGPELEDLQNIIESFEQKVVKIEHQIYDPNELVNLLLPVIADILSRKVTESEESKGSVADAIMPIIDEVIQAKVKQDRHSMGRAIAPAIPTAISEEVRDAPREVANAIAPDMAAAIEGQIRLDRQAMVRALYPIIHEVIHSKREEDIEAISAAIAPLLPSAISEQIRNSPHEIAQAIGPEMAGAMREQIRLDREAMIETLGPEMGKAIKAQIEIERDAMVDALYPVIGSTIAKYMADVVRTINEKIENTLSMEGMNRKMRAMMQGVSEGELIVKEAVPFKVRAAFLIHKQSGLVVSEAQTDGEQNLESDMVAGMLTAIRSFVNDCIAQSGDVSEVDAIDYGNSKIILEVAGYCYLAVVTQGETPQWFIYRIQQTLQTIVEIAGNPIEHYEGDPSAIPEKVNEILANLANLKRIEKKSTTPVGLLLISSLAAGLILIPWGYFQHRHNIERRIEQETAQALSSAPELAVYHLSVDADNDKLQLSGKLPNQYLRKRAAQIAQQVAPNQKLSNQIIAVEMPPDPVLTEAEIKRVTAALNQINGIAITSRYAAGKVTVEGIVGQARDAGKITQAFKQIPGVKAITNTVQLQQLLLPARIYFDAGKTELKAENKAKIWEVKAFLLRYPETTLTIIGHSDTKGSSHTNQRLALWRAEAVRQALVTEGINPKRLQAVATPNPPLGLDSNNPLWLSRCVRFQPVHPGFQRK